MSREETIEEMKSELENVKYWQDRAALIFILGLIVSIPTAVYGIFINQNYIGVALINFFIASMFSFAIFHSYDNYEEEIKEELKKQKLEKRIEELERKVSGEE